MPTSQVRADRAALRCTDQRRAAGGSAVGTTPSSAGLLLVEVPLPWPAEAAAAERLAEVAQMAAGHRLQAVLPRGDLPDGQVRLVRYGRGSGAFDQYRKLETVASLQDLAAAVTDLVAAPLPAGDAMGAGQVGSAPVDVLICTHGARDVCCGRAGTPLYRDLVAAELPGVRVWRTSHLGGHRFAPTAMTLPDGRAWAWLDESVLAGIVRRDLPATTAVAHDRGCAGFDDPWAQAADHAVFGLEGWAWLDRPRTVSVEPVAETESPAAARRRVRVTGRPFGRAAEGGDRDVLAYEVVVEVARRLPVPVCGEPPEAAVKVEDELRVVHVHRVDAQPVDEHRVDERGAEPATGEGGS